VHEPTAGHRDAQHEVEILAEHSSFDEASIRRNVCAGSSWAEVPKLGSSGSAPPIVVDRGPALGLPVATFFRASACQFE
jgi:hypothetical protein